MPSVQVRDILDSFRQFYGKLAEQFEDVKQYSEGQVRYLLEYIAHHERELETGIARFEDEAGDEGLFNTWMQFGAAETLDKILDELDLHDGMSESEALAEALKADGKLIALYKELAGETSVPDVRDHFENLAKMQDARTRQLARAIR